MHEVASFLQAHAETLAAEELLGAELTKLTDKAADLLRQSKVVRMNQPKEWGGYEASPREFFEVCMAACSIAPSIGWVAGVVGIHTHEIGQLERRIQEEVWGGGELSPFGLDTWMASPYAPQGVGKKVDGGLLVTGRWTFSSGTDHCQWVVLGCRTQEADGSSDPGDIRNIILPRGEYEIVEKSWDVMGLSGTGSRDIVLNEVFVPEYRAVSAGKLQNLGYAAENNPGVLLYQVPHSTIFPGTINAATMGIAEGALRQAEIYMDSRVMMLGDKATENQFQLAAFGAAKADIMASRLHILDDADRMWDKLQQGHAITPAEAAEYRANQVRATHRSYQAIVGLFQHQGGTATRLDNPAQRFFRDLTVAMGHICNQDDQTYANATAAARGLATVGGRRAAN